MYLQGQLSCNMHGVMLARASGPRIVPGSPQKLWSGIVSVPKAYYGPGWHQVAWAMPCGPLMLYSIYQACTAVWVCADMYRCCTAPLCCVLVPQALLCKLKFAVSYGGGWLCSWISRVRAFRTAVLPWGLSVAPWVIPAEGDP